MGGEGKIVEADETYYGKPESRASRSSAKAAPTPSGGKTGNKRPIVALVERGGNVRTFHVRLPTRRPCRIVRENIAARAACIPTKAASIAIGSALLPTHETVKHCDGEYVRGDVHTNSAEGYFSIFKRGMRGIYQHCGEKHLHRYLAEFDFRYNHRIALGFNDGERATLAVKGAAGKRLTYR